MIYRKTYSSPFGIIYLSSDGEFLTGLWFEGSNNSFHHNIDFVEKDLKIFDQTIQWLDIYFSGKSPNFTPKYKIVATQFRKRVIDILIQIPYGKTITYKKIADLLAKEMGILNMSAQAVGNAVGWNPICVIIPCHRVIGTSGNLIGYSGGLERKFQLLCHEKVDITAFHSFNHSRSEM